MSSRTSASASDRFLSICFLMRSFFRLPKKDSTTALSQQLPVRLIPGSRRFERQQRRHASLPHWAPRSECIRVRRGRRCRTAISTALRTTSRCIVGAVAHASIVTTERYGRQKFDTLRTAAKRLDTGKSFKISSRSKLVTSEAREDCGQMESGNPLEDEGVASGAGGGNRTHTTLRSRDFESVFEG